MQPRALGFNFVDINVRYHHAQRVENFMTDGVIQAQKFVRIFDYMEVIGVDLARVSAPLPVSRAVVEQMPAEQTLPARDYFDLYKCAIIEMEKLNEPLPWAAGMGGRSFEMLAYSLISCRTLREALTRAEYFAPLMKTLLGYQMRFDVEDGRVHLHYCLEPSDRWDVFAPDDWDRQPSFDSVSRVSGLLAWSTFCGWLVGRSLDLIEVRIAAPHVSAAYTASQQEVFQCPLAFESQDSMLVFEAEFLDYRLVHNDDSLRDFLSNAVYQLMVDSHKPASTSAAIKSLMSADFSRNGLPSFQTIAECLHMSESSLRRRLLKEQTSYQILKDEFRCELAVQYLRNAELKVNDIADLLGFTEPSSFVRSFKNWTQLTPRAYREKLTASN